MFGIFDLAFLKIVDPTIFVREYFIFAGNSLARRAGAFFFARNSFARRRQFSRAEEMSRGKLPRRGEYRHDKESKILGISKLSSHCAYAKMPSLPKCISQMQNCWRAIFKVFDKFQECKVQLYNCWRCS